MVFSIEFPTRSNREYFRRSREMIRRNREFLLGMRHASGIRAFGIRASRHQAFSEPLGRCDRTEVLPGSGFCTLQAIILALQCNSREECDLRGIGSRVEIEPDHCVSSGAAY